MEYIMALMVPIIISFCIIMESIPLWRVRASTASSGGSDAARPSGAVATYVFKELIDIVTAGSDLSMDVGRKEAYNRCYEYARENLSQSPECNVFLAEAAEVLGQTRIHLDLVEEMAVPSGAEKIYMAFDGYGECELIGNRSGLAYLSRVFKVLSETPMEGEHLHFRKDEPAMQGNTHGLTVFYEPDGWFDRYADRFDEEDEPFIPERKVASGAVIAVCITVDFPPAFYMSKDKIYRVVSCEEYDGRNDIPAKRIRESMARMYTFSLVDDRGEDMKFTFDLDDQDVVFLTCGDLEQVIQ